MATSLIFDDKVFCFTGTVLQLKRTRAERETRARGGVTVSEVNDRLDFLARSSFGSTHSVTVWFIA
jgi:NAD-dependent DNA ligase